MRVREVSNRRRRAVRARGHKIDAATTLRALPEIGTALQARKLVEIIGPSDLLKGIKDGSLSFTEGANGFTTVVRGSDGTIVGHAQLQWAHGAMNAAIASAVWQVAAAVTLQHYLHRIDKQLSALQADLRALRNDAAWAVLERGADEVASFVAELKHHGRFDAKTRQRLDAEERAVDVVVRQELHRVEAASTSAHALAEELRQLMSQRDQRGKVKNAASTVVGSMPGGVKTRLLDGVSEIRHSTPSWELVCRGREIHAALVLLQLADDSLAGNADDPTERLQRDSLTANAASAKASNRSARRTVRN